MSIRPRRRTVNGKVVTTFQIDFVDQLGVRHRPSFKTRTEAKNKLLEAESRIKDRTFRSESETYTIGSLCDLYLKDSLQRVKRREIDSMSQRAYANRIRKYITAQDDMSGTRNPELRGVYFKHHLNNVKLVDLRPSDVKSFVGHLRDTHLVERSVRGVFTTLRVVLSFAVDQNFITYNVAKGITLSNVRRDSEAEEDGTAAIPEKAHVAAICAAATGDDRVFLMLAAATGLRSSEQRALRWRDYDPVKKTIEVRRRVNQAGEFGQPKSKAGRRIVPVSAMLAADLDAYRERTKRGGADDLIFPNLSGNAISHANMIKRLYKPAWQRAASKWSDPVPLPWVRWHSFRHFAISCWIEADVPLKQVQQWAGHASANMTLDVYGHLFKSADNAAVMDSIGGDVWGT